MLTKFISACLLNALLCFNVSATVTTEVPRAKYITSFSFRQFSGGVILLKATVNDFSDSLNFILDTGCGGISMDSVTCARLGLATVPSDVVIRGIAGARKVSFANNNTLRLPGLRVDSLNFHINDYEILTNVYGEHIDGIIGQTFFSRYIVKVNYDSNRIHIYAPGTIRYPRGGHLLKPQWRSIPVQPGRLTETAASHSRFYLDIGAGMCLVLSSEFAADSIDFIPGKKMFETQAEGIGGKARMMVTTVKEFKLGPYRLKNVPAFIFDDTYNVTEYPHLGGLIGNDLLRRFNTVFNYPAKEIHLLPNKRYREKFDYSYTGLGFYFINGVVEITDIMKDSPGDKAGLTEGDVIIGINNILNGEIQDYKSMLMETGKTVKMLVMRKNELIEMKMKIADIRRR